jgi:RNA polymerase sigma-70 factor (ECF subfamily)
MDLAFSSSSSHSALSFGSNLPATWTVEAAPVSGPRASAEPLVTQPALTEAQSEDAALLEGLLNNDRAAWRTFETRYGRLILSCIARVTSRFVCVRPDDVREIQATLYLELISNDKKKLRSFEQNRGTRFGTWLGLLATHTAYDFLRRARRDSKCDGIEGAEALRADTPDPSDYTLIRERAALVSRLLDTLSAKDREFVELYYGEGLPAEEVAERMQISVKTVYTKKHKLQGRLEGLLGESRVAA